MKITSIGHESWLISTVNENILVDPVLGDSFGTCPARQFKFVPDRTVLIDRMPKISAIIFTTEHLQHFQPKTLLQIKKFRALDELNVFVPELFPAAAEMIINEIGFSCIRVRVGESVAVGSVFFTYYMPRRDVLFWDARVASLYLRDASDSIFIQSDTAISADFFEDVTRGRILKPKLLVVTNNFQRSAEGHSVGLDNLLPIPDPRLARAAGLRLLDEIISVPHRKLGYTPHFLIAGNGYMNYSGTLDYIWSNEDLAGVAQELSILGRVFAMQPGKCYCFSTAEIRDEADWIVKVDRPEAGAQFSTPQVRKISGRLGLDAIKRHLDLMAKSWLITTYGQALLAQNDYLGRVLGAKRLSIILTDGESICQFVLDISKVSFDHVEKVDDPLRMYPFGIVVDYQDFSDLLTGDIQVWEVMNLGASQWYVCDRYQSPLAFWLEYFNEQVDNERAYTTYQRSMTDPMEWVGGGTMQEKSLFT